MTHEKYVQNSIDIVKEYEPMALRMDERGYCVCSSFGKDSMALIEIFRMAGVKFFIQTNVTGIDPPELVYFGREQIKRYKEMGIDTFVVYPRKTMFQMIVEKGLPPTRIMRYCCDELKERNIDETKDCFFSFGVRKAESVRRSKRGALEVITSDYKKKVVADVDLREELQLMMFSDNDEKRMMFENCVTKGVRAINPIIWWTDSQLWKFIKNYNVPYCKLYDEGKTRLGCIMCPMNSKSRRQEAESYPKFYNLYLKAFDKMLIRRKELGKETQWKTAEEVMQWWLQNK